MNKIYWILNKKKDDGANAREDATKPNKQNKVIFIIVQFE